MSSDPALDALVSLLKRWNWQCACAESCTGGGLGERLTRQAGSSVWFDCGIVVYSNAAKSALLGVSDTLLSTYGAVSEQVASAMATGLLRRCRAQTVAAITGIAGPDGGSEDKPVGSVVFAWAASKHTPESRSQRFSGDRGQVRALAVEYALTGWAEYLRGISK